MIEKLMEYQEVDKELKALEDGLKGSEEFKKYVVARKFLKTVNETKAQIEDKAKALVSLSEQLKASFAALAEEQSAFDGAEEANDLSAVSYLKKKAQELSKRFAALESEISKLDADISELTLQYKKLVKNTNAMKEQHDEYKVKYEGLQKEKEGEKQAIEKRLAEIARSVPKEYMERYLEKRKDNKFPICYELEINPKGSVHCSACGTEFSSLQLSNLKQDGFIECEHCRKLIFLKK